PAFRQLDERPLILKKLLRFKSHAYGAQVTVALRSAYEERGDSSRAVPPLSPRRKSLPEKTP
ncbi:MAG: hypothetical protein KDD69_20305, partial [Bdellovibrionales bacterium]|nr:hypothetical protein [Bdellovibrionales bacterium]